MAASVNFSILGLDHVVLRVADLERAIGFYCDVLGCTVERRAESMGLVQLRAGKALIDLIHAPERGDASQQTAAARNMDHFAIRIEPFDEAALAGHLQTHGVTIDTVARRYGAEGNGPSVYIADPDGNTVELKGPSEPPNPADNVA